ncbi:T9SS type A sorting domain-containing protein [Winogradskyella schleiferi]|uniref:T9SS type A sorting domain-containing protein n=1 Tax=Winogradskyella schleiferi TaxID=2686078 RepID=UPI0015BE6721|nr:T9SS type A sorting domain-containing protein [Winogradskyella schleiferi]
MTQKLQILFLFLTLSITAFAQVANPPADLEVCDDDNDGFSQFDLTFLDAEIIGSQNPVGLFITYHETQSDADNGINLLSSPFANTINWLQTIYIRLEDNNTGSFDTTIVDLIVIVNPIVGSLQQPASLNLCDDVGEVGDGVTVFDLTDKDAEITGGNADLAVSYYETNADGQAQTNVITNPTAYTNNSVNGLPNNPQTLFVVVTDTNTGCVGYTTLTIRVLPNPYPTPSDLLPDLVLCDDDNTGDETEMFDLTENEPWIINGETGQTVTYHISENDALSGTNSILNPTQFANTMSPQTIYARTEINTTGCFAVVDFDIIVSPLPSTIAVTDFIKCELFSDGIADFDLTLKDDEILNGQEPAQFNVYYYISIADALSGTNALASPYTNTNNPQQIFVTITNNDTDCSISTQSFNIEVQEAAQANPDFESITYEQCDDNVETDGDSTNDSVQFDLSTLDSQLLDGQNPSSYTVTYYANEQDAILKVNPLPQLYQNDVNPQTIYASVTNDYSGCDDVTSLDLLVNPLPVLNIESNYVYCIGDTLILDTELSEADFYFVWYYNGNYMESEASYIIVTEPGSYHIQATSLTSGCYATTITNVEEVVCTDTDNDGVIDGDEDINNNGNLEDDDTDDDGIPNYLDDDDDGDNVDTIDEINIDLDRNSIHSFIDTDNDLIENYLDNDDDGDNVLTIDEDYNNNGDPTDDDTNNNSIPDYLESGVALSLNEFSNVKFNIFPNPAKEEVKIQLSNSNFGTGKINIYNIQGKVILKDIKLQGQSSTLSISNLESGLYFVELRIGNGTTVQKLIVN